MRFWSQLHCTCTTQCICPGSVLPVQAKTECLTWSQADLNHIYTYIVTAHLCWFAGPGLPIYILPQGFVYGAEKQIKPKLMMILLVRGWESLQD